MTVHLSPIAGGSVAPTGSVPPSGPSDVGGTAAFERALRAEGATEEEIRFALAHKRAQSGDGNRHYAGADGSTDGSRCFGPLNMNEDMLRRHGLASDPTRLNEPHTDAQWRGVAKAFLTVYRAEGRQSFTHHVLDGYGGWRDTTAPYLLKLGLPDRSPIVGDADPTARIAPRPHTPAAHDGAPDPPRTRLPAPAVTPDPAADTTDRKPPKFVPKPFDPTPGDGWVAPSPSDAARVAPRPPSDVVPDRGGPDADPTLAANQRMLRDALLRRGATPEEVRTLMTIQLLEDRHGWQHDASKDHHTDKSRNFSPLNLNEDMLLRHMGPGDFTKLNLPKTPADWDRVAHAALTCLRAEPRAKFFHHLRNGYGDRLDTTDDYMAGFRIQYAVLMREGIGYRSNHHVAHQ